MNLPKNFEQTCNKPYDRHEYKLFFSSGKSIVFDNYEDLRRTWWETSYKFLDYVEVLDRVDTSTISTKRSKGFG